MMSTWSGFIAWTWAVESASNCAEVRPWRCSVVRPGIALVLMASVRNG
ncbi:hypothetical protein M8R20_10715 [Pseudomonas sp. R2.Fl]|nr:hypothetical protein [Pseudomonas sp. R2.Fl]